MSTSIAARLSPQIVPIPMCSIVCEMVSCQMPLAYSARVPRRRFTLFCQILSGIGPQHRLGNTGRKCEFRILDCPVQKISWS